MDNLKSLSKLLIPKSFLKFYRHIWSHREKVLTRSNSGIEQVFTDIYEKNEWGGNRGDFFSGYGSVDKLIVSAYITMIKELAENDGFIGLTFVDLGCGDFRIGEKLLPLCSNYIGIDIVEPLIRRNQEKYSNLTTHFQKIDIVCDELPNGDVAFLRQVLQHLSNKEITAILPKLKKYKWVFITEHYPTENSSIIPNIDKIHGGDIRVYKNSGVYLSNHPFDLPDQALTMVLELPGLGLGNCNDQGVIRTFLYKP